MKSRNTDDFIFSGDLQIFFAAWQKVPTSPESADNQLSLIPEPE